MTLRWVCGVLRSKRAKLTRPKLPRAFFHALRAQLHALLLSAASAAAGGTYIIEQKAALP
jgi:hypothetical protein